MICLTGAQALSEFRLQRLHVQIRELAPSLAGIGATYLYFVKHSESSIDQDSASTEASVQQAAGERNT